MNMVSFIEHWIPVFFSETLSWSDSLSLDLYSFLPDVFSSPVLSLVLLTLSRQCHSLLPMTLPFASKVNATESLILTESFTMLVKRNLIESSVCSQQVSCSSVLFQSVSLTVFFVAHPASVATSMMTVNVLFIL